MESKCEHIDSKYESIEELKKDLNRYNLPIDIKWNFKELEVILWIKI